MNLQLSSDTLYTAKYVAVAQNRDVAYYQASAACKSIIEYIKAYYSDDPKDLYANMQYLNALTLTSIKTDDADIQVEIEDLERRFAINSIIESEEHLNQLNRIFQILDINAPHGAEAIADWIDADSETRVGGNESHSIYGEPKNAYIDSIKELEYIEGIKDAVKDYKRSATDGNLEKYIYASKCKYTKININTASKEILQSLSEDMTEQEVNNIIENRPIQNNEELRKALATASESKINEIIKLAGYTSEFFQIKITATHNEEILILTALIDKNGKIISWKAK